MVFSDPRCDGDQSHQVLGRGQGVQVVIVGIETAWLAVSDLLPRAKGQTRPAMTLGAHDSGLVQATLIQA
jgi:hypothetical protein